MEPNTNTPSAPGGTTPALRMIDGSDTTFEGYLVHYDGGLANGMDLYHTRFGPDTKYHLDWFTSRPLLYHHGQDETAGTDTVGTITSLERRDAGVWMQAQLDRGSDFYSDIVDMIAHEKLALSSGTVDYLMKMDARSGDIIEWPIVEGSLTPTPGGLNNRIDVTTLRGAFRSALIDAASLARMEELIALFGEQGDVVRSVWTSAYVDSLPDGSFAYVEPTSGDAKSKRHLPYKDADGKIDEAHLRNALSRLPQTDIPDAAKKSAMKKLKAAAKTAGIDMGESDRKRDAPPASDPETAGESDGDEQAEMSYEELRQNLSSALNQSTPFAHTPYTYIMQTFPAHVIVCRCGDEDDDDTYWDVQYTINGDDVALGDATQVEKAWVPVDTQRSILPFTLDAQNLAASIRAFVERTKDLDTRRAAEHRTLSTSAIRSAADVAASTEALTKELRDFGAKAEQTAEAQAEAEQIADPAARAIAIEVLRLEADVASFLS